jgi:glycine oxidase
MSARVIVIGGGVIGLACALELARGGAETVVLDDGGPPATAAAAGMLCPSFEALHFGGPGLARMGAESLALWDGFAASLSDDPGAALGYRRDGAIGVGFPPRALKGEAVPVPRGFEAGTALLVPEEGQVEPRALLRALGQACRAAGVRFEPKRAAGVRSTDGIVGIETEEGLVEADAAVCSGGASALARALSGGRLMPVRGRAFLVRGLDPSPERVVRSPSVYLCPRADGTAYVGATEEERDMPSAPDALWHEACWLMPGLRATAVVGRFDGVRPGTADGLPIIERSRDAPGLVLALGHHRNGVLLAPLTARRVAAYVAGTASSEGSTRAASRAAR